MLTGIHFLLTYKCTMECEHCFVYSSPNAKGTFTLRQIKEVLDEVIKIGSIEWVFFEGGEPFMYYPLMLEGIKLASDKGFKTGLVTNAYWAECQEDADLWLAPLYKHGLTQVTVSDDLFHYEKEKDKNKDNDNPAKYALSSAKKIGIPFSSICVEKPSAKTDPARLKNPTSTPAGSGALLKGRAVDKLAKDLPRRKYNEFTECKEEDLKSPKRVHLDSFGNIHLCQGLLMGNMWKTPLSELVKDYDPQSHPICGPLLKGGPVRLAEKYKVKHEATYSSACHFCYLMRLALIDRFPEYLAPRQIYGLE